MAAAAVGNAEDRLAALRPQGEDDALAGGAVLGGVIQKDGEEAAELFPVAGDGEGGGHVPGEGLACLEGHGLEGESAVLGQVREVHVRHGGLPLGVLGPGEGQHLLHEGLHLPGLGEDVVPPAALPLRQVRPFQHLGVGEDDGEGGLQLVGGVREELALLPPGPLHRPGDPEAQKEAGPRQEKKAQKADAEVGGHHLPQGGGLQRDVHKGDLGVEAVILPEVAEGVAGEGALVLLLGQAVRQDGGEGVGILQARVGAAGHIDGGAPDLDGEVGQEDLIVPAALMEAGEEVPAPAGEGLLQGHVAAALQRALGGGPDAAEDDGEDDGDEAHAGGHELPAEFFDHGAGRQLLPPLAGVRGAHASSRQ